MNFTEGVTQGRWDTTNTKLAACLLVYGFRLCREQPFTRIAHADRAHQVQVTIWFDPVHPDASVKDIPFRFKLAWQFRAELDRAEGQFEGPTEFRVPLQWMRRGLEARDYLLKKVVNADARPSERHPDGAFKTADLALAACLIAHRRHLFAYDCGAFVFDASARETERQFVASDGTHSVQWCKKAIVQQDLLIAAIRGKNNTLNHWMRVGKETAIIPENCPPSVRQTLIRELYV